MDSTALPHPNSTLHTIVGRKQHSTKWLLYTSGVRAGLIRLFTLKAGRRNVVFGSVEMFVHLLREDGVKGARSTIRNAIASLEQEGFLYRLYRYRGGSQVDSVYLILLDNAPGTSALDYLWTGFERIQWAQSQAAKEQSSGYGLRTKGNPHWTPMEGLAYLFAGVPPLDSEDPSTGPSEP
jgi:hypothetical protein